MATLHASNKYAADCQCLHRCFAGKEAASSKMLEEILTGRSSEELKHIRQIYSALYSNDILFTIASAQKHNMLAMAAYLRISDPIERDAETLRGVLGCSKVDFDTITEILCTRSSLELHHIRQAYLTRYGVDVGQDLALKADSNFKEVFHSILNSTRFCGARVDRSLAMCDAKTIYEAMESGKSIDSRTILSLLSQRNNGQLKAILLAFKQLYGHDFCKSLKQPRCGGFGKHLSKVMKCIQYPEKHFVKQLRRALSDGKAPEILVRVVSTRAGIDIKAIQSEFSAKTNWSLESLVRSEFGNSEKPNGLVAEVLLALLKK